MKNFKYYLLFVISLSIFIYTAFVMPTIEKKSDLDLIIDEATPEEQRKLNIANWDKILELYQGNVSMDKITSALELAIADMYEMPFKYDNSEKTYEKNKEQFAKELGTDNYKNYLDLYNSQAKLYNKENVDDPIGYDCDIVTVNQGVASLTFDLVITQLSGIKSIYTVRVYNEIQDNESIIKILPKVVD